MKARNVRICSYESDGFVEFAHVTDIAFTFL